MRIKNQESGITNYELRIADCTLRPLLFTLRPLPFVLCLLLFAILSGCSGKMTPAPGTVSLIEVFPTVQGWSSVEDVQTYDADTIFDLVNGQADAFFAYNFEQVAVRSYTNAEDIVLRIEIWQLATPTDAYGLFTRNRAGVPVAVGHEGDGDPGRRIAFWQDRYYVQVRARQDLPDATLKTFAEAMAAALPTGGTTPALVVRLPKEELVDGSAIFFRQEISIQDLLWLGGENILGLSGETEGLLARYELDGATAYVLLVKYLDADAATAGLGALQGAALDNLVSAEAQDRLLGAVFGDVDVTTANALLSNLW